MRITARLEYALRALLRLAAAAPAPVTARDLADTQGIPAGYVYDVLADLRRAGLVLGVPGRGGGYVLSPAAASMTVAEVLHALDGPDPAHDAADGPGAGGYLVARLHELWTAAESASEQILDRVTLADLARPGTARPQ